ncbi:MAG TPA: protein kinase [Gemmataceae bacterium]|nr:protein kinase [Gemmataceae bacterium]
MSDPLPLDTVPLSLYARRRIADACALFDQAVRDGRNPAIEEHLPADWSPEERRELLKALLEVEVYYRQQTGEALHLDEYLRRFPDEADAVRSAFPGPATVDGAGKTRLDKPSHGVPSTYATRSADPGARDLGSPHLAASFPSSVGDYDILGELGRGGMGVVYRAVQRKLKRPVALKMILAASHAGADELKRFRAEAEAIARLRHPNIVQIYEVGEEGGRPFFSLELVEGGNLDRRIRGTPQPARLAAGLVAVLARAMHAAHQSGVLHRDLKPANVLLARKPDGAAEATGAGDVSELPLEAFEPKITDFGLAKRLDGASQDTHSGAIMGTPSYMALEQAKGRLNDIGPATDVYGLAAILYELLTGRPPFKGATVPDTLELVCTQEPVPPSRLQPKVPRDLETICLKGLRKDARQRYASARELAEVLHRFLNHEPILARRAGVWERGRKYARRRPWVVAAWAAGIAALLFLAAGGSYFLYRQNLDLEAELSRQNARAETRVRAATGVAEAEDALKKRDWPGAVAAANEALARVGDDPAMADLRKRAGVLQQAAQRVLRFTEERDRAMFHAVLALEEGDQSAHGQAARAAAHDGLALFGLADDGPAPPAPFEAGLFGADVEQWLAESCYELYLTWAEVLSPTATATPEERRARAGEALHLLDRAGQLGLVTRSCYQRRAQLLQELGEAARARQEQEQAAALAPSHPVDHFLLGMASYRARDWEQARAHLMKVLERQPDHFWASYCLAGCYLRQRPPHFERALAPLTACVRMKPALVWPYLLRGFVNGELGDFEAAFADFDAAEKLATDDVEHYGLCVNRAVVRLRQGMGHEERARALRRLGRPGEARREDDLAAPCYDAAVPDLERAAGMRPQQPQAYANLAEAHLRRGRLKEALPQLDQAITLAPSAALYRTRAGLHETRGAYAEALPDLNEAIRLGQAAGSVHELADDQLQRGRIFFRLEKYGDALEAFDQALVTAPDLVKAHQLRGETLLELGCIAEAVAALDRYLAKGPPPPSPRRRGGWAASKCTTTPAVSMTSRTPWSWSEGRASRPTRRRSLTAAGRTWPRTRRSWRCAISTRRCGRRGATGRTATAAEATRGCCWVCGGRRWRTAKPPSKRSPPRRGRCTTRRGSMPRRPRESRRTWSCRPDRAHSCAVSRNTGRCRCCGPPA